MCAAAQGKFWNVHDRIFATAGRVGRRCPTRCPLPTDGQLSAGVDTVAWNKCLADDVMVPLIDGDRARGRTGGVDQTPYFFIGYRKVGGAVPARDLRPMLDSAIVQAGGPTR